MLAPTKPSTTINGALLAVSEVLPLILILIGAPGSPPLLDCITTPAARPWIACAASNTGKAFNSSAVTEDTAPVISLFLREPYPTTTISSNAFASSAKTTFIIFWSVTVTDFETKPM